MPVLLVSAFVSDRVAVAQWGLTRVVAGLLRALCIQATLPLAAELGHDHAVGLKEQLRNLYARGSVFLALLASLVVSGLLPFWPDFFALWTHGAIPYDPLLTVTLLIGTSVIAPSILALGYANYSNRGNLVARTKGLQLAVFLILSVVLIRAMGPLGAAIAIVASDLLVQFGLLGAIIIGQTLRQPFRHVAFLAAVMTVVTLGGWGLGTVIRSWVPWTGLTGFVGRMHTLAHCCSSRCEPAVEQGFARPADRGDPALAQAREALPIVKMGGISSPASSEKPSSRSRKTLTNDTARPAERSRPAEPAHS